MEASEISPDVAIDGIAGLNDTSSKYKVIIIDGMALVNAIPKTERIKTCKDFAQFFLDQLSNMADEYDEVRLVFDRYINSSLKEQMRRKRTKGKSTYYHVKHRRTGRGGRGGQLPPQFGEFVDMNSGRESTLFGQNTIHV